MFESDDFDQVLSQFDFADHIDPQYEPQKPELSAATTSNTSTSAVTHVSPNCNNIFKAAETDSFSNRSRFVIKSPTSAENCSNHKESISHSRMTKKIDSEVSLTAKSPSFKFSAKSYENRNNSFVTKPNTSKDSSRAISPKQNKRKMINSFFDVNSKRKFPGPAGLLTGSMEESKDDNICQMELLSQDTDFSQNILRRDAFDSPLWVRLVDDVKSWGLGHIDSICSVKNQALSGNLRKRKAHIVTAFIEALDRSSTDPLIILRDVSGNIKCTLHRDAWSAFSPYLASEACALVLIKPTVLTTGGAFKKHYLNITLNNIHSIYSSAVLKDDEENRVFPEGYSKIYEDDFTVIKADVVSDCNLGLHESRSNSEPKEPENDDLLEGLDGSTFFDDLF